MVTFVGMTCPAAAVMEHHCKTVPYVLQPGGTGSRSSGFTGYRFNI